MFSGLNFAPLAQRQRLATDFGDYATGAIGTPDWENTLDTSNYSAVGESSAVSLSGRRLKMASTSGAAVARSARYIPAGSPADTDILCLCTPVSLPSGVDDGFAIYARGVPNVSAAYGEIGWFGGGPSRGLLLYYGTSFTFISFDWSGSASWWMRLRVISNNVKFRVWALGSAEPGTWQFDQTGSGLAATGHVGMLTNAGPLTWASQFFSVASGGGWAAGPAG